MRDELTRDDPSRDDLSLDDLTLDDLVIRASSHTPFFGIYLASHAISDALCMCHASVGCKVKTELHLCDHDGIRDAHSRRRYSQLIDEDLMQGSTAQLEEETVAWQKRLDARLVVLEVSTPVNLQGLSLGPVVARLEQATRVDVVHVPARLDEADLWTGYAATAGALLERQVRRAQAERLPVRQDEVSIVGYPFDRYEADHTGNVAELRRLLWALGLKARAVFFAGEPYATLREAAHARAHLLLPWAHGLQARVAAQGGHALPVGLPMGLEGTRRFLTAVAQGLQLPVRKVEAVIASELERIRPQAELARRLLRGRSFAVFADAPRAAGVVAVLHELGMVPTVIGVLHRSPGGRDEVERILREHHGLQLASGVQWLVDPAPHELRGMQQPPPGQVAWREDAAMLARRAAFARADVVLGSTVERDVLDDCEKPWIEFGFPSERRHALYPAPWLGYSGVLRLAEQVAWALERVARLR